MYICIYIYSYIYIIYIYILLDNWGELGWTDPPFTGVEWTYYRPEIIKLTPDVGLSEILWSNPNMDKLSCFHDHELKVNTAFQSIFKQTHTVWFDSQKIPAMFAVKIPQFPRKQMGVASPMRATSLHNFSGVTSCARLSSCAEGMYSVSGKPKWIWTSLLWVAQPHLASRSRSGSAFNTAGNMEVSYNGGTQNGFLFPPLTLVLCDIGRDNQLRVKSPPRYPKTDGSE